MRVRIVESDNVYDFEKKVNEMLYQGSIVQDIKFSVASDIHSGRFGGSYSAGEIYYAMIIYAD